ncbi:CASP-like protein 1F2 [Rhodamnia argentea]|uniref:CASP-like protein n=1 Tax=Rhodamnia argentea TaxID=178133 RepID=A0A8B8MQ98_9MYRT|nr:CASP-like protein 1F2 [Rhodamnia argentea]
MVPETAKEQNSFPEKFLAVSSKSRKRFLIAQASLRVSAFVSALIALSVMLTSNETIVLFGIKFRAYYSYASAFRFLLGADAVVCGFSLLSLILLRLVSRSGSNPRNCFFLFLHDLAMTVLMISACAAGTAIGYVGRYGEEKMGWVALCNRVTKFCNQVLVSVVFSYLAFFCYLAITIISASKLPSHPLE